MAASCSGKRRSPEKKQPAHPSIFTSRGKKLNPLTVLDSAPEKKEKKKVCPYKGKQKFISHFFFEEKGGATSTIAEGGGPECRPREE